MARRKEIKLNYSIEKNNWQILGLNRVLKENLAKHVYLG